MFAFLLSTKLYLYIIIIGIFKNQCNFKLHHCTFNDILLIIPIHLPNNTNYAPIYWTAITPLSELSVVSNSIPGPVADFECPLERTGCIGD
jgi:hypothetical protein